MNSVLDVQDLRTWFYTKRGIVKAVDGVSFCLNSGETIGLVGESGCGKTITSLSILRLIPQPGGRIVGGRVMLNGEDIVQKTEREMRAIRGSKISMIQQDPMTSLNPAFTVGDQVGEAILLHQKNAGRILGEMVKQILGLVRIAAPMVVAKYYPHQMSGGMRQRVAGAIAISCRPDLLIADEPTTALDVTIQAQYLGLLKDVQRQFGAAMIFITHDLGIVERVCDRVAVMYAGKIVETASASELLNKPAHPYTTALLRSLPKVDAKVEKLYSVEGQPPSLLDPPTGCGFAARCATARDRCRRESPPVAEAGAGHIVRCWSPT